MPAADHLNPRQYHHMRVGDLADPKKTEFADLELYDDNYELMKADKIRNAYKSGLQRSIELNGVQKPVSLYPGLDPSKLFLDDGHHRVFAADHIDPDMMIPVRRSWADE